MSTDNIRTASGQKNLIAIDGGGTKTEFLLLRAEGIPVKRIVLEGCNPNICGPDRSLHILKEGILSLLEGKVCHGIFCGMAGILSGDNLSTVKEFLTGLCPEAQIKCGSDILNVAYSGTKDKNCIAVICGTGSNVSAVCGTEIHRVGGWGYLFDGAGSGYDLGRDAITTALAENDGIGPHSLITRLVEEKLGGNVWDNIGRFYSSDKAFIASFSEQVFAAHREGDKTAGEIIERNARALADKINFASTRHGTTGSVVLSGGIISHNEAFVRVLLPKLREGLEPVIPSLPPIFGAARLCSAMAGAEPEERKFGKYYESLCENA